MLIGFCECGRELVREDAMRGKRVKCPDCGRFVELVTEREAGKVIAAKRAEADPLSALADAAETEHPRVESAPVAPGRSTQRMRRESSPVAKIILVVVVLNLLGGLVWLLRTVDREIVRPGPQGVTFTKIAEPVRNTIFSATFVLHPPGSDETSYSHANYFQTAWTPTEMELVADGNVIARVSPVPAKTEDFWRYEIPPQAVRALMQARAFEARFGNIVVFMEPDEWAAKKEWMQKAWKEKPR